MKKEIAERWVAALRSGIYKQGIKYLCKDDKYCCLGVLCDILKEEAELDVIVHFYCMNRIRNKRAISYDGSSAFLPKKIVNYCYIKTDNQERLALMNDSERKSFNEIADYIEQNWENL